MTSSLEHNNEYLDSIKCGELFDLQSDYYLLEMTSDPWSSLVIFLSSFSGAFSPALRNKASNARKIVTDELNNARQEAVMAYSVPKLASVRAGTLRAKNETRTVNHRDLR
jgi:hypothetical protein